MKQINPDEFCGYGCGRKWDELGDFDCVSAYHVHQEPRKSEWLVLEDDSCIHVIPETDIKPHGFSEDGKSAEVSDMDCPCKPRVDFGGRKPMIVHNSFKTEEFQRIQSDL